MSVKQRPWIFRSNRLRMVFGLIRVYEGLTSFISLGYVNPSIERGMVWWLFKRYEGHGRNDKGGIIAGKDGE